MDQGMSDKGSWGGQQLNWLNSTPIDRKTKGWKDRIIGSDVPAADVKMFLKMKNAHLKRKEAYKRKVAESQTMPLFT